MTQLLFSTKWEIIPLMSKQDRDRHSVTLTNPWVCLSVALSVDCDRQVKQVNQDQTSSILK